MRLRRIKNANEAVKNCKYIIQEPENNKGKWKNIFNNKNPIYVEIGMGRGKYIIEMAKKYPGFNFIGIEAYDSIIVKAVEKLETLGDEILNLKLIKENAKNIERMFDNEISCILLNFSDPWSKTRHEKRRLTSNLFLSMYDKVLLEGETNRIIQKTDNLDFFEYSIYSLKNQGYILNKVIYDLHNEKDIENITTEYEEKFLQKGIKIKYLEAIK